MNITLHIPFWILLALVPAALLLLFEQIWVRYLAVMHLKQVMGQRGLKPAARFFGFWMVLPIGVALDWLGNVLASLVFLDPPAGWSVWARQLHGLADLNAALIDVVTELITGRLQRYEDHDKGWRRRLAVAFADDMLNDFDPPSHIKRTAPVNQL